MMMLGESSTYFTPYWQSAPWITSYNPYGYETRVEDVHYYYTYSPQSDSDSSTRTEYHMKEVSPPASPKSLFKPYEDSQVKPWKSPEPVKVDQEFCCRWKNCGNSFGSMDALSSHVSSTHSDTNGGLFYCGWEGCSRGNKGFNARYKMLVHVRTHTNEKPHRCTQCEKSFSRAENLKIHVRSHSGEKPYICPVEGCNKAYSNSSDRFKHTRTHSVDRPYFCKIAGCHKRYTDPSSLRKHVKTFKHITPSTNSPPEHNFSKYSTVKQEILKRCDPNRINGNSNGSLSESELYDRTSPAYPIRKYCYSESDRLTSLTPPTISTFHNEEPLDLGKRNYTAIFENGVLNLDTKTLAVDAPLDLSINRNYV